MSGGSTVPGQTKRGGNVRVINYLGVNRRVMKTRVPIKSVEKILVEIICSVMLCHSAADRKCEEVDKYNNNRLLLIRDLSRVTGDEKGTLDSHSHSIHYLHCVSLF